jgi:hypothetical protein
MSYKREDTGEGGVLFKGEGVYQSREGGITGPHYLLTVILSFKIID